MSGIWLHIYLKPSRAGGHSKLGTDLTDVQKKDETYRPMALKITMKLLAIGGLMIASISAEEIRISELAMTGTVCWGLGIEMCDQVHLVPKERWQGLHYCRNLFSVSNLDRNRCEIKVKSSGLGLLSYGINIFSADFYRDEQGYLQSVSQTQYRSPVESRIRRFSDISALVTERCKSQIFLCPNIKYRILTFSRYNHSACNEPCGHLISNLCARIQQSLKRTL